MLWKTFQVWVASAGFSKPPLVTSSVADAPAAVRSTATPTVTSTAAAPAAAMRRLMDMCTPRV